MDNTVLWMKKNFNRERYAKNTDFEDLFFLIKVALFYRQNTNLLIKEYTHVLDDFVLRTNFLSNHKNIELKMFIPNYQFM